MPWKKIRPEVWEKGLGRVVPQVLQKKKAPQIHAKGPGGVIIKNISPDLASRLKSDGWKIMKVFR